MEAAGDVGFAENMRQQNAKLLLMVVASLVAAIAQFYEKYDKAWTFPVNRVMLFICCSLYFTASGVLQYVLTCQEKDCIAFYKPFDDKDNAGGAPQHAGMAVHTTCNNKLAHSDSCRKLERLTSRAQLPNCVPLSGSSAEHPYKLEPWGRPTAPGRMY
jgi:hypothetical protein